MSADVQIFAVGGKFVYTFDWSDEIPVGATMTQIDYVLPTPLTSFADSDDLVNFKGNLGCQGVPHGMTCQVIAKATLSNGEVLPKALTVTGFSG